jgi:hypothetical protein
MGGGKQSMTEALALLDNGEAPPAPGSAFEQTRRRLAPEANLILMADLNRAYAEAARALVPFQTVIGSPVPSEEVDRITNRRVPQSFFGLTATADPPHRLRIRAFLPCDLLPWTGLDVFAEIDPITGVVQPFDK